MHFTKSYFSPIKNDSCFVKENIYIYIGYMYQYSSLNFAIEAVLPPCMLHHIYDISTLKVNLHASAIRGVPM
jgi:hypothetical protein